MPTFIEGLGQTAATAAATSLPGAIFGLALEKHNDKRQLKQQGKLQELQISGQKQMTDYNMAKQLQMWKDTNYSAQVEELDKAGLNPGLLYGMSGGGGTTTGSASGSIQGASAPTGGREILELSQQNMQLQLLKAQKENIEADTANKQADTANKPIQGKNIEASTLNLTQDVENKKAQQELTEVQTRIMQIEEDIKGSTSNAAKATIFTALREATERLQIITNDKTISNETKDTIISKVKAELAGQYVQNELTRAGVKVSTQQLANLKQELTNSIKSLNIQQAQQTLNNWAEHAKIDVANKAINFAIIKSTIGEIVSLGTK